MESLDNSVIVCDSPGPAITSTWGGTNYASQSLLDVPYKSPLNHLKRTYNLNETPEILSYAAVAATPPTKRRRKSASVCNPDLSVVVVDDEERSVVVEAATLDADDNDICEVPVRTQMEYIPLVSRKKTPKSPRIKKKTKRATFMAKHRMSGNLEKHSPVAPKRRVSKNHGRSISTAGCSTVNDENHDRQIMEIETNKSKLSTDEDAQDIEVVWSSRSNVEKTNVESSRTITTFENPIIVDVTPSESNFSHHECNETSVKMKNPADRSVRDTAGGNKKCNTLVKSKQPRERLREIIIDGLNVALGFTRNKTFSETGLKLVIDYFKKRRHVVRVFMPQNWRRPNYELINKLHVEGTVIFTPSRRVNGRLITPYDDRYIVEYATKCKGIVITSDQYKDLWAEKPEWRDTIENRLLAPTFVGNYLMFPEDPLGRGGPSLEDFLRHKK